MRVSKVIDRAAGALLRRSARRLAPLELDQFVLVTSAKERVLPYLDDGDVGSWFRVLRQPLNEHVVALSLPGLTRQLFGTECWTPARDALLFTGNGRAPQLNAFLSVRSVILPQGRLGTEVWVHVEVPREREGERLMTVINGVVGMGLARIQAELGS